MHEDACRIALAALRGEACAARSAETVANLIRTSAESTPLELLEALARLARIDPTAAPACANAILHAAARTPAAWRATVRAGVYVVVPAFADAVAEVYAGEEYTQSEGEVEDKHLDVGRLRTALDGITRAMRGYEPPAPAHVAMLAGAARAARAAPRLSSEDWERVPRSAIVRAIGAMERQGTLQDAPDELVNALAAKLDRPSLGSAEAAAALRVAAPDTAQRVMRGDMGRACAAVGASVAQLESAEEAFAWARSSSADEACSDSGKAHAWQRERTAGEIAAAYVARPALRPGITPVVADALLRLPAWMRGDVDEDIDAALACALVPCLQQPGGVRKMKQVQVPLRTAVQEHAWLARRRAADFGACAHALVNVPGEDVYRHDVLSALVDVLTAWVHVEQRTRPAEDVVAPALDALALLGREGRAKNGVPFMFAPLAHAIAVVLAPHADTAPVRAQRHAIARLRDAPGTAPSVQKSLATLHSMFDHV